MKETLNSYHISILVHMTQVGVVIFSLPRLLAEKFGYNGWLGLFILSFIASVNIYLISLVYRIGKGKSVYDILEQSLPKWIVYPLYIGLTLVWTLIGCLVMKQYVLIYQMVAFPSTHPMVFKLIVDILAYLLVIKGLYNITKAVTVFFYMIAWMALLNLMILPNFDFSRLTPFIFKGETDMLRGGLEIYTAFLGYELSILFIPHVQKSTNFFQAVVRGNLLTTASYLILSFVCFGFYSFGQLKNMLFPLLDLLAYIKFPFIERVENLLYGLLLFASLITTVLYLWGCKENLSRIALRVKSDYILLSLVVFSFAVSWIPRALSDVKNWIKYLGYIETGIAFGLPLLLIVLLVIKKEGKGSETA